MSNTPLEWVTLISIIIIIIILVGFIFVGFALRRQLVGAQDVIYGTTTQASDLLNKADPLLDYARNAICNNPLAQSLLGKAPPELCPVAPAPASR